MINSSNFEVHCRYWAAVLLILCACRALLLLPVKQHGLIIARTLHEHVMLSICINQELRVRAEAHRQEAKDKEEARLKELQARREAIRLSALVSSTD
jgi:hypothetical protein